ncbi:MAG: tetratricopeptide repeat protein [Phycisphaerales bacterium]|nr:tetratricopeptide repeat protein [Phycisphaerales bacterium]
MGGSRKKIGPSPRTAATALPLHPSQRGAARPRYARWRAATLCGVYVLMGLHIAHWKIAGKTLAPLELNEVMYTLELGIVTAGFIFMAVACLATLIFGRFFCGWGCHILALQDLCSWLLKKMRIRARPIRSRLLLLVPPLAMFYMFMWPQVTRVLDDRPMPTAHVRSDEQGWASFQTTNFWRNLPGPGIALLTFGVCGFGIVYVLGSRSFCAYGCPYGAVFRGLDRLSPGRILAGGDCSNCGVCTAACPSGVIVHEELMRYGTVVNSACVRDLECVAACPNQAVKFGWTRPPLLRSWRAWHGIRKAFDYSLREEALLALVWIATLLTFRGLYDAVPFLMTLGLGAMLGHCVVVLLRLVTRNAVRLHPFWLKLDRRLSRSGAAFVALSAGFAVFWCHSAAIRYHEFFGYGAATRASTTDRAAWTAAIDHLEFCRRWGLVTPFRLTSELAHAYAARGEARGAQNDIRGALADLREAVVLQPGAAGVRYNLGVMLGAAGQEDAALAQYQIAAQLDPRDADIQNNLGFMLARRQDWPAAEKCFRAAVALNPEHADAHFNLARVLAGTNRMAEASTHFAAAARLNPQYADLLRE